VKYFALLAIAAPWLYDRYLAFSPMLANRPGNLQEIYGVKEHEFKFRDRIRNCEDAVLDEGMGLVFLTCDSGRDTWNTVMVSSISNIYVRI
jgi:arylesterase/paraoxonase